MQTSLKPYIEILLFTSLYLLLGYLFSPQDPIFLESKIPLLSLFFAFSTLFYGVRSGLLSFFILLAYHFFIDPSNKIVELLPYLLLILVMGQFYHYWVRKNEKLQAASSYTVSRLNELNHAFYALKISHDALEKSYALKPKSIRSSLEEITSFTEDDQSHFARFLLLLQKSYQVQEATISLVQDGAFKTLTSTSKNNHLLQDDPLVQRAIQEGKSVYISQDTTKNSHYLAVIPIQEKGSRAQLLLSIESMPFLEFTENNIIAISILFSYFIDQITLKEAHKQYGKSGINKDQLFTYHYGELLTLYERFKLPSSVVVLKAEDALGFEMLQRNVAKSLRALDHYQVQKDAPFTLMILLPFTSTDMAESVVAKLTHDMQHKSCEYMVFDIENKTLISQYIKKS